MGAKNGLAARLVETGGENVTHAASLDEVVGVASGQEAPGISSCASTTPPPTPPSPDPTALGTDRDLLAEVADTDSTYWTGSSGSSPTTRSPEQRCPC
ncbi:hypothetical protein [Streptomyces sp. KL116D]|uniref:hypothetical protein n=1 Tax=Streptomyces sp. KL116D TaxID=3045152 RepID=UPI0035571441